jgi:heme acquisition protein HasA
MSIDVTYSESFFNLDLNGSADPADNVYTLGNFFTWADDILTSTDYDKSVGDFAGEENPDPIVDLGFWGAFGTFSGTQYTFSGADSASDTELGFIIETSDGSYLDYTFFAGPTHTLYGEITSITFGSGLVKDANGEYSFSDELVTIDGLDTIGLNNGVDASGDVIGRNDATQTNDTHEIVNALMNTDVSTLIDAIDDFVGLNDVVTPDVSADLLLAA